MAMTATLAVDRSVVAAGTLVAVRCIVANSSGGAVNVTEIIPRVSPLASSSSLSSKVVPFLPASVPAGGTRGFGWSFLAHATAKPDAPQAAYQIGATITCADGTVIVATGPTVQVASPFDAPADVGAGHLRLDSNLNDGLLAVV